MPLTPKSQSSVDAPSLQQRTEREEESGNGPGFAGGSPPVDDADGALAWSTSPLPPMILVHRRKENSSLSFSKRLRQTF